MEKIRQDFFSWLPSSDSSSAYAAPDQSYNTPEVLPVDYAPSHGAWARKLKKVQTQKVMKSNKSIS